MSHFSVVLGAVLPVFLITGVGFALRRLAWLTADADQSLLRLTINLLLPCLVLDAALGNPAVAQWRNLLMAPLVGAGTFALGLAVAGVFRGLAGVHGPAEERTFTLAVGLYNYGFVPIPLALLLFGDRTVGVLFLHNMGVELALWTLGVLVLTGFSSRVGWKQVINPPLIAILVTLLLNAMGGKEHVPKVVLTAVRLLGQCAIPISLILAGATIDDHLEEFQSGPAWRVISTAILVRLLVLPAAFLGLAAILPVTLELKRVMLLQASMPSAVFPIVMAKHYKGDPPTALRVVLGTSLAGLVTMPLWIRMGILWLQLP